MPTPSQKCPDCDKKMTYDPVLSDKSREIKAFWCIPCSHIIVEKRFIVKDAVQSVRRYVFKGELP